MDCGDRISRIARFFFITNFTPIHIFVTNSWRCKFMGNDEENETKYKIQKYAHITCLESQYLHFYRQRINPFCNDIRASNNMSQYSIYLQHLFIFIGKQRHGTKHQLKQLQVQVGSLKICCRQKKQKLANVHTTNLSGSSISCEC